MATPFTRDDLMALWKAVVDPSYSQPLLENPDSGIEAIEQAAEQFARASVAIERSLQAFYARPWSGQDYPPASGARRASVDVEVSRTGNASQPLLMFAGQVFFEEQANDYGVDGGVVVGTGRRYTIDGAPLCIPPGATSAIASCLSERPGFGYNAPPPDSITAIDLGSTAQRGIHGTITPAAASNRLSFARGDIIPPAAVGQYVQITFGANAGQLRRVLAYSPPDGASPLGSVALDAVGWGSAPSIAGTFTLGEEIDQAATGARAVVRHAADGWVVWEAIAGAIAPGAIVGAQSGAVATIDVVTRDAAMTAEIAGATWQLLEWSDLGVSCTNAASPVDGANPELDMIGEERGVGRAPGEEDVTYRERVDQLPDTVSPNAVVRAANRVLSQYGLEGVLREAGDIADRFPGFFYDTTDLSGPAAYAYDLDFAVRPRDRYKLYLSLLESRAFFLIGLPRTGIGEFGFAYDLGGMNFFDDAPLMSFFDGFPATAAYMSRAVWDSIDNARAAGVGFDLVADRYGAL